MIKYYHRNGLSRRKKYISDSVLLPYSLCVSKFSLIAWAALEIYWKNVRPRKHCYKLHFSKINPACSVLFVLMKRNVLQTWNSARTILTRLPDSCKICCFFLCFKRPIFPFFSNPEHNCLIRHCLTGTKQQESSATLNAGGKCPLNSMQESLHFIKTQSMRKIMSVF